MTTPYPPVPFDIGAQAMPLPTSKDAARDVAIDWQSWQSQQSLSMSELLEWQHYFEELADRFDLAEEFRENGIL